MIVEYIVGGAILGAIVKFLRSSFQIEKLFERIIRGLMFGSAIGFFVMILVYTITTPFPTWAWFFLAPVDIFLVILTLYCLMVIFSSEEKEISMTRSSWKLGRHF